jgi:hypothetical protein
MNEENPVGEFLKGCGIGFLIVLVAVIALGAAILLWILALTVPGPWSVERVAQLFFAVPSGLLGLGMGFFFIRKIVVAFSDQRPYFGMGLLSFFLIPLLFFGVCTMFNG